MRRAAAAIATLAMLTLIVVSASAAAATLPVNVQFQAFAPDTIDALTGDAVTWNNHSGRTHTVTADGGAFDSGDLVDGSTFTYAFTTPGIYAYHCTVHRGMVGEVDVRRVTLDPLPAAAVPRGVAVDMNGRTADPAASVRIERDTGNGFQTVATASADADGDWKTRVTATKTARFRAAVASDVSETRRLLVIDRRVQVRVVRGAIAVTVVPSAPYARVSLQLYLRDRFGWWPTAQKRLDYLSKARFRVRPPVRARVALLDRDGWTPLALSPVVRLPGPGAAHGPRPHTAPHSSPEMPDHMLAPSGTSHGSADGS